MHRNRKHEKQQNEPAESVKWIDLREANECIESAARITLESRLAAVIRYLPLAALKPNETPEHVHRLRVSTRRVLAALRLYRDYMPRKRSRWLAEQMREIRKAAGAARDLDVLRLRYESTCGKEHKRLRKRLVRKRKDAQHSIMRLYRKLIVSGKLKRRSKKLAQRMRNRELPCKANGALDEFAQSRLNKLSKPFFKFAVKRRADVRRLHEFRIQAKELRYTIELLCGVLPSQVRSQLYPAVCQTQDLLGELNDHRVASKRLRRLGREETRTDAAKQLRKLSRDERRKMKLAIDEFYRWWNSKQVAEMRAELRCLCRESA